LKAAETKWAEKAQTKVDPDTDTAITIKVRAAMEKAKSK
jgi:hypothetical protein